MDWFRHYPDGVWAADFEFAAPPGGRPVPLCLVARELRSGRLVRLWLRPCLLHARAPEHWRLARESSIMPR